MDTKVRRYKLDPTEDWDLLGEELTEEDYETFYRELDEEETEEQQLEFAEQDLAVAEGELELLIL